MKLFQPIGARLLVKRLPKPKPTGSLIEIPDSVADKPSQFALVLAVGKLKQSVIKVNEVVVLSDFAGAPVSIELVEGYLPEECSIVNEEDVLAVVDGL